MRQSILYLSISTLLVIVLVLTKSAIAQVYSSNGYYYNNFDDGNLGAGLTVIGNSAVQLSNTNLAVGDGSSLKSTGSGLAGGYQLSFLPNGTNLNNEPFGYEWTMIYKNDGEDTDNPQVLDNNENSWRYWLYANNTNQANLQGYYLTQNGKNLEIRLRKGVYDDRALVTADLSKIDGNKTTYAVRVQRLKRGSQFVWKLFVDGYSASTVEASTLRGVMNYEANTYNLYNYAALEVVSTTSERFKFDELKLYSMQINVSGANDAINGVSNVLYPGWKKAVIYGVKIETRGYFDIYQLRLALTGNITSVVEGKMKLYKSPDPFFGNKDDEFVAELVYYDGAIQNYSFSDSFYTLGNADGSLGLAFYYYIAVEIKDNPTPGAVFSISGAPEFTGSSSQINYSNTNSVNNVSTSPASIGNIRDWTGKESSDWSEAENWSPKLVPGVNDLVRIGVSDFKNQPLVNTNQTVGNILFGKKELAVLTVNATLKVNNNAENLEGMVITGAGTLDVKGSFVVNPTNAKMHTTVSVANFNLVNLLLDAEKKEVTFNVNGINTTISSTIQTTGDELAVITVGTNSQLTLLGANPFSLGAANNVVTLNTGSTVRYAATVAQTVSVDLAYENIVFSGAGIKKVAAGNLNVSGNWISSGGKIDLLSNKTAVFFNGGLQNLSDNGSDTSMGLVFGNVTFTGGNTKTLSSGKFAVAEGTYLAMGSNTILQANNRLTLKASALGSASVSVVPENSAIQGQVTVEKYIQGGSKEMWRTNRMLSSPIYDNTTNFINTDGGRTYSFTQFIDDIIITGKGGALNGFDSNAGNVASAWTYVNGFVEIPTINTSLAVGKGAYIYYRGSRNNPTAKVTAPFIDAESIVMTFKGTLNQQSVKVPLVAANLLGNPYAATIDWNSVTKTNNVNVALRVWNPSNRQYSTYNGEYGINGGTRYIGPGQAFFVQSTGSNASVTFTESAKISNVAQSKPLYNTIMSVNDKVLATDNLNLNTSQVQEEQPFIIRAKLAKTNAENSDETLIILKNGALATVAGADVTRLGGEGVFLSSLSAEGKQMAINYMPHVAAVPSVKLGVATEFSGSYELRFSPQELPVGYEIKLKDNLLNTIISMNTDETLYEFEVNKSVAASFGMNRFEILINPLTTLPVLISSFNANKANEGVVVKWTTSTAINHSHFNVQRAGDDKIYEEIETVEAQQNGIYQIVDRTPLMGYNYYRLVQVDRDAKTTITEPIVINYELNESTTSGILVYPTITDANYTVKYNGSLSSATYDITVSDVSGKTISQEKLQKSALENGYKGVLPNVKAGVYFLNLVDVSTGKSLGVSKVIRR